MPNLNFTISELINSETANKLGINNIPADKAVLDNMLTLIVKCLQPLRDYVERPITVNSGYRCKTLNAKVGGVSNSQHLTGQAADILIPGLTINEAIQKIQNSGIVYDQLIHEGTWVHISYNDKNNRKQFIKV